MRGAFLVVLVALLYLDLASCFVVLPATAGVQSRTSSTRVWQTNLDNDNSEDMVVEQVDNPSRRNMLINTVTGGLLVASGVATWQLYKLTAYAPSGFRRAPTAWIAALGDPSAKSGTGANQWGVWSQDPGPRGVWLRDYSQKLEQQSFVAPVGWKFDPNDWWVEEHGLIMETPQFPLAPGRYLVTGGRSVTTGLTIQADGRWMLDEGSLYDVTHLPCRAARYIPNGNGGSPANARLSDFPVKPGGTMPSVAGTDKQDYAVLFLVGKAV